MIASDLQKFLPYYRKLRNFPSQQPPYMSWVGLAWHNYLKQRTPYDFRGLSCNSSPGLISIVLPVFNGEDYLGEALESILTQTYALFELIIVDDGSTDGSLGIAEGYGKKDARISIIHQENQKLPKALSLGFAKAQGQFLTWTSADNRMKAFCLGKLVAALENHPAVDMVYGDYETFGKNKSGKDSKHHVLRARHDTSRLNLDRKSVV